MSLYLEFEPHSWYMGFAIKAKEGGLWSAYTDDGNTYTIVEREASTLKELKALIKDYHKARGLK
jgi:hypothetical protein